MDNSPGPEQGSESPVYCATTTNASTMTTEEEVRETEIQTSLQDNENIMEIQSNENAGTSADTNEAISATQHGYDNICSSVNSQDSQFSSPLEASSDFEMPGGSRNHSAPNDMVIVSSVCTQNRKSVIVSSVHTHERQESVIVSSAHTHIKKRSVSNDRMTTESNPDHKRSKSEIGVKSGKDLSTDNEQNMNNDKTLGLNAASQIAFNNSALAGIDDQNIESNNNISQICQNVKAADKITESIESERGSVCSVDNGLGIPGPSSLPENKNTSILCGEAFQSFTCRVCKVTIAEHATEENNFKCCYCSYTDCEEVNLQIHSYTHVPEITCSKCEKKHAAGNSHNSEHRCPACPKTIRCRTQLYEHFLVHPEYFEKNCWICRRGFSKHIIEKDSFYICCVCGYQSNRHSNLDNHNRLHLPRYYCKLCKEEYSKEEKRLHGSNVTCFECHIIFKCQPQLEDHYEIDHGYSPEKCRICKGYKNEHFTGTASNKEFQCCKKECLQNFDSKIPFLKHLFSHTGLRDFKCHKCGRRFDIMHGLNGHSLNCKALRFKCELCETKFHSRDILREHHLVNHRQA